MHTLPSIPELFGEENTVSNSSKPAEVVDKAVTVLQDKVSRNAHAGRAAVTLRMVKDEVPIADIQAEFEKVLSGRGYREHSVERKDNGDLIFTVSWETPYDRLLSLLRLTPISHENHQEAFDAILALFAMPGRPKFVLRYRDLFSLDLRCAHAGCPSCTLDSYSPLFAQYVGAKGYTGFLSGNTVFLAGRQGSNNQSVQVVNEE